jgi:membrane protein required for colicin V production
MNIFDIIVVIIIGIFALKGLKNGFVKELCSLVGLIAGIYISIRFSCYIENLLKDKGGFSSEYLPLISYAITFIGVVVIVLVFSKLLNQFIKLIKLQWLNKIAGICFGTLKVILILGGLFFLFVQINAKGNFVAAEELAKTKLFYPMLSIFENIFPYVEQLYKT